MRITLIVVLALFVITEVAYAAKGSSAKASSDSSHGKLKRPKISGSVKDGNAVKNEWTKGRDKGSLGYDDKDSATLSTLDSGDDDHEQETKSVSRLSRASSNSMRHAAIDEPQGKGVRADKKRGVSKVKSRRQQGAKCQKEMDEEGNYHRHEDCGKDVEDQEGTNSVKSEDYDDDDGDGDNDDSGYDDDSDADSGAEELQSGGRAEKPAGTRTARWQEGYHARCRRTPEGMKSARSKKKSKSRSMVSTVGSVTGKSVNAMMRALQPKSVGVGEVLDSWKLEQVIGKPPGKVMKCAATIEFRRDGTAVTSYDGRESISDFTFRSHSWPRACTIEFEAKAFQGPWDEEPVWKRYKGSFSRKLLDPKIILLEGTIYDLSGRMMWRRSVKSGKFIGRRRPSKPRSYRDDRPRGGTRDSSRIIRRRGRHLVSTDDRDGGSG